MITPAPRLGVPARSLNGVIRVLVGTLGVPLPRCAVLRVHGRNSGVLREVPLLIGHHRGSRYLVAPRGNTEWARNLTAAGWGELVRGRRVERVTALPIDGAERVDAIAAYLSSYGWLTRNLFGLPRKPGRERLAAIAPGHPTFRISTRPGATT